MGERKWEKGKEERKKGGKKRVRRRRKAGRETSILTFHLNSSCELRNTSK